MRKLLRLFSVSSFVLVFFLNTWAVNKPGSQRSITDVPNTQVRVHHEPNVEFTVTNFGLIGSQDGLFMDPEPPGQPAPGFEMPAGSGLLYLFEGCLWIGAEIDTTDQNGNHILDTLVSVGNDGWWGEIYELMPPPQQYQSLWEDYQQSDEDIHAIYYDTVTDQQYVLPDPNDGRPHIPLGLKVTQTSSCWSSPGYDEVFIINYYLENIGNRNLYNAWIGIYYDGDVHYKSEDQYSPDQGPQDDLCGFIEHGDHGIAWIADNDGQPYPVENGVYTDSSVRDATGLVLLKASAPELQTNFNWWISNINAQLDWGPRRQHSSDSVWLDQPFPGGGMGTPGGDKAKYQVMSNGEHDYDQVWSDLNNSQHPGWILKPPNAGDLANGYDTRFLISFGPMQIPPGQIDTVTLALIGGRHLHNDPMNYINYLKYRTSDSSSIAQYYAGLDFSDLIAKADSAYSWFHNGYPHPPTGPPRHFRISSWSDTLIRISWYPKTTPVLREYRLYRGTQAGIYDSIPITPPGFNDTIFIDRNIDDSTIYYYVIASIDTLGRQGGYSPEISINPDQPHAPIGLSATAGNQQVSLTWTPNQEGDLAGYIIYRKVQGQSLGVIDSSEVAHYQDTGMPNGYHYYYKVAAYDQHGNVSAPSDSVMATPMGLDQGILLLKNTLPGRWYPDTASISAFYNGILNGYTYAIRESAMLDSLPTISNYSTVIFCSEFGLHQRVVISGNSGIIKMLEDYLNAGGNLILAGPRNLVGRPQQGPIDFGQSGFSLPINYLNISGAVYPPHFDSSFVEGQSVNPDFPDFILDSLRVSRIGWIPIESTQVIEMGVFVPFDANEVIYNFIANNPDSSNLQGRPIGIIHHGPNYKTTTLEFPLYFIQEPQSYQILHNILTDFGEFPTGINDNPISIPKLFSLSQNYPNPFNPATTLSYYLPLKQHVTLNVYNLLGQKVEVLFDGNQLAGKHSVIWNADRVPSGIYFARLQTKDNSESIKMVLLK